MKYLKNAKVSTIILQQLVSYFAIGVSGLLFDSLIFFFFRSFSPLSLIWSNVLARHFGAVYTFTLNKVITFKSRSNNKKEPIYQFGKYVLLLYFSLVLSTVLLITLTLAFEVNQAGLETIFKFCIDFACALLNFFICKYFIFKVIHQ